MIQTPYGIQSERLYRPGKPVRDPIYRRFVKSLPCANCGTSWGVDPCHTGPHGTSQKSSDMNCIPLCRKCHIKYDKAPYDYAEEHKLDVTALIVRLNNAYELIQNERRKTA